MAYVTRDAAPAAGTVTMKRRSVGACWVFAGAVFVVCASVFAAPGVVVRGRVIGLDGKPVAGVLVDCYSDGSDGR